MYPRFIVPFWCTPPQSRGRRNTPKRVSLSSSLTRAMCKRALAIPPYTAPYWHPVGKVGPTVLCPWAKSTRLHDEPKQVRSKKPCTSWQRFAPAVCNSTNCAAATGFATPIIRVAAAIIASPLDIICILVGCSSWSTLNAPRWLRKLQSRALAPIAGGYRHHGRTAFHSSLPSRHLGRRPLNELHSRARR